MFESDCRFETALRSCFLLNLENNYTNGGTEKRKGMCGQDVDSKIYECLVGKESCLIFQMFNSV